MNRHRGQATRSGSWSAAFDASGRWRAFRRNVGATFEAHLRSGGEPPRESSNAEFPLSEPPPGHRRGRWSSRRAGAHRDRPGGDAAELSDTEILIGMMTDLSGITAVQGSNAANSIRMAFDEINTKGGINGRKIHFIAEDMEYLVPKAAPPCRR